MSTDKKQRQGALEPLNNSRGVALMMAIFIMAILTFLAVEVSYRTSIENNIAVQSVSRVKAYYAAKAAIELSLFRIHIYKNALASLGETLGNNKSLLDVIWQFPFMWPPVLPDESSEVDKSQIQSVVNESSMKASYAVTIESEGSKIDVNDLASESKELVKATKDQLIQIFQSQVENDEKFADRYGSFNFEELVNNMIDWVDENTESLNGGAERDAYRNTNSDFIPPNAPFKTLKELHMVALMTDDLYSLLAPRVTVYGSKGINVNYSDKTALAALDPQLTPEIVEKIIKRRSTPEEGGLFQSEKDFLSYIESLGVRSGSFNQAGVLLTFDAELNFRIKATGQSGRVVREIEVVTYDIDNIKERYIDILTKAEKAEGGGNDSSEAEKQKTEDESRTGADGKTSSSPADASKKKFNAPKGRPTIVYWNEN